MVVNRAYKFRMYPQKEQQAYFSNVFGAVRFLWNNMLANRIDLYERFGSDYELLKTNKPKSYTDFKREHDRKPPAFRHGVYHITFKRPSINFTMMFDPCCQNARDKTMLIEFEIVKAVATDVTIPKEMTLSEIEKKLGHKVAIVTNAKKAT